MTYYFCKKVDSDFETTIQDVTEKLKEKGFGVLTEIDVQATLKKKIDIDFYQYKILGACNPHYAYKSLMEEDKIGVMLPCNVIIQQKSEFEKVEVSTVNPIASMGAVQNEKLAKIAIKVTELLKSLIEEL